MAMKKGILFTLSALLLVVFFMFSISYGRNYSEQQRMEVMGVHIQSVSSTVALSQDQLKTMVTYSTVTALRTLLTVLESNYSPTPNAKAAIAELLVNGSYQGDAQAAMNSKTLGALFSQLKTEYEALGILLIYSVQDIVIQQTSAWNLQVNVSVMYNLSDVSQSGLWSDSVTLQSDISLLGWDDPVFLLGTNGTILRTLVVSDLDYFINTSNGDTANLVDHISNGWYVASNASPNYLMRLEGNISAHAFGFESLVNVSELVAGGFNYANRTATDFLYFSTANYYNTSVGGTPAMPTWFKIDGLPGPNGLNRSAYYNATTYLIAN